VPVRAGAEHAADATDLRGSDPAGTFAVDRGQAQAAGL
jgi:hypothetical protein